RRRASGADHAPLGAGQLGEPPAGGLHQLVEVRVVLVGQRLRLTHLRPLDRTPDDRQRAARIDQRAHAERLVERPAVGSPRRLDEGRRRPSRGGRIGRCRHRRRGQAESGRGLEELPPAPPAAVVRLSHGQKRNFAPSSMRRIAPADVMRPNAALPSCVLGLPQLTVLNRLKISARSCRRARPPTNTFFISDRLVTFDPGPRIMLRGALPNVYWSGIENADSSMQLTRPSPLGLSWQFSVGLPVTFGRCAPRPMLARSPWMVMFNGVPLSSVVTVPTCQPPSTWRRNTFGELRKNGMS